MADTKEDSHESNRQCQNLLHKLKTTVEGLLAGPSVQDVWAKYGGLRRVCEVTQAILEHRIIDGKVDSHPKRSFWQFVQALKWLVPNMAPVIEKLGRYSLLQNARGADAGHEWLRESVHDHTLVPQLDILLGNTEHLYNYYYTDAFLCQAHYVEAMRICFRAIELNKPALLININSQLLRIDPSSDHHPRSSSIPTSRTSRNACFHTRASLPGLEGTLPEMGKRHSAHLEVSYSGQVFSSTQSLSPDSSPRGLSSSLPYASPTTVPLHTSPPGLGHHQLLVHHIPEDSSHQSLDHGLAGKPPSIVCNDEPSSRSSSQCSYLEPKSEVINTSEDVCKASVDSSTCELETVTQGVPEAKINPLHIPNEDPSSSFEDVSNEAVHLQQGSHSQTMASTIDSRMAGDLQQSLYTLCEPQLSSGRDFCIPVTQSLNADANWEAEGSQGCAPDEKMQDVQSQDCYTNQDRVSIGGSRISWGVDAESLNIGCGEPGDCVNPCENKDEHESSEFRQSTSEVHSNAVQSRSEDCPSSQLHITTAATISHNTQGQAYIAGQEQPDLCKCGSNAINPRVDDTSLKYAASTLPASSRGSCKPSSDLFSSRTPLSTMRSDPSGVPDDPLLLRRHNTGAGRRMSTEGDRNFYTSMSPVNSPGLSPAPSSSSLSSSARSSGVLYIPPPLMRGASLEHTPANFLSISGAFGKSLSPQPVNAKPGRAVGHKRWVSDTSAIQVDPPPKLREVQQPSAGSEAGVTQQGKVKSLPESQKRRRAILDPESYPHSPFTRPVEGQSLLSYLTSQDFNTCATMEKENAHFHISEALIAAFESMRWNRMMKQKIGERHSSSSSSSDEEIQELRQRIRIRKHEKLMEKGRPFPSMSDGQTDTATTSQSASSQVSSSHQDVSSLSDGFLSDQEDPDIDEIDLTMSSDDKGNLLALRSSGLNLSMASLYSVAELQRSNQQLERNSSLEESVNPGSAESIAISLLRKFSEKHLPKASELKWLVSEHDAPQRLLPLPSSIPVSPDDGENADVMRNNRTRLRGNLEWAPPRGQIIFCTHPSEKRAVVMARQNYRCAGCGVRVDPALVKRYRYCEYLGKYFCQCCHTGETSTLPGRVLERWDFSRYSVANFSYTLLEKMWNEPLFHVDSVNPMLYKRARGLEAVRERRQQLEPLHSLLAVCNRDPRIMRELQQLPSHWVTNDNAYSMDDFTKVKSGEMLTRIKSFISLAITHVDSCPLCQGLGFLCGVCQDPQVIFPFQLHSVTRCPLCQACYHRHCFTPGKKCPKCLRLEARRRKQEDNEVVSPGSPDQVDDLSTSTLTPEVSDPDQS